MQLNLVVLLFDHLFTLSDVICGHHVYKNIWALHIGEEHNNNNYVFICSS